MQTLFEMFSQWAWSLFVSYLIVRLFEEGYSCLLRYDIVIGIGLLFLAMLLSTSGVDIRLYFIALLIATRVWEKVHGFGPLSLKIAMYYNIFLCIRLVLIVIIGI